MVVVVFGTTKTANQLGATVVASSERLGDGRLRGGSGIVRLQRTGGSLLLPRRMCYDVLDLRDRRGPPIVRRLPFRAQSRRGGGSGHRRAAQERRIRYPSLGPGDMESLVCSDRALGYTADIP